MSPLYIRLSLLAICLTITTITSAQDLLMRDVFSSMPDTIFTYLTRNNRLDMIDFSESNMKAEIDNSLGGKSRLDTLTSNYLHLTLNESAIVEMKLLKSNRLLDDTTKTIVCMATTYSNSETCIEFYTSKWHSISIPLNYDAKQFIAHPDTMALETYNNLSRLFEEYCVVAKLSPKSTNIELTPTFPTLNEEEKNKLDVLKRKIILKFTPNDLKYINN